MRHSICLTIAASSRALIFSVVFSLTCQLAECANETAIRQWKGMPAICDNEYRAKYFNDQKHYEAVLDGRLFVPPDYKFESATKISTTYKKKIPKIARNLVDYLPEFSPVNYEYRLSQRAVDEIGEWPEFTDEVESPEHTFYAMRKFPESIRRNLSVFDERNLEHKWKSKGTCLTGRKGDMGWRNIIPRRGTGLRRFVYRKTHPPDSRVLRVWGNGSNFKRHRNRSTTRRNFRLMHANWKGVNGRSQSTKHDVKWTQDSCKSTRRIVGGLTVRSAELLPYMAFVDSGCGGAIIGKMWVLTAGHCVDNKERPPIYVHVGNLKIATGCQYNVAGIHVHPRHTRKNLAYDIGILKISPSFIFSPAIQPIGISSTRAVVKSCGVVAGWGAMQYKGSPRMFLKMTTIPVILRKKCRMFNIKKTQFCAGYDDARADTCQGDSGGPFVVQGIVVGIISHGYKCAKPKIPGVYIDVSYHRRWIRSVTGL